MIPYCVHRAQALATSAKELSESPMRASRSCGHLWPMAETPMAQRLLLRSYPLVNIQKAMENHLFEYVNH